MPAERPLPPNRLETQARVCAQAVVDTLNESLLGGKPADRCLKDTFYANRQFGSRDRRLISETLFALLRWWGWLQHLAPPAFVQAWQNQAPGWNLPGKEWYKCLYAAWLLDNPGEMPPAAALWGTAAADRSAERSRTAQPSLAERSRVLKPLLPHGLSLSPSQLVPEWTFQYLAPEENISEEQLLPWLQKRPPVWLRAQTSDVEWLQQELADDDIPTSRHERLQYALKIERSSNRNFRNQVNFKAGDFEVQDLASQAVAHICAPRPGEQWWDACAGGGGKTLHLAWLMQGKGSVLATDIRLHKLQELKLRARRAQFPNIRCKEWKGKAMPTFRGRFAGVLVDTPCTCSGTWRRNPDLRWTARAGEVADFVKLQLQLLSHAAEAVAPGGTLVYSTCSMFRQENQGVVEEFLRLNSAFALAPFTCPVSGRECPGYKQLWPWDGDCNAMFTAKFQRR